MRTMTIKMAVSAMVVLTIIATPMAQAADLLAPRDICIPMRPAILLQEEDTERLTAAVVDIMNEAVAVSTDQTIIDSRWHAFTWATEAKIACGKAYGYLRARYRDEQYINRCECYFKRMQYYLH